MNTQLKALYELQQVDLQIASARKALAALDNGTVLRQQLAAAEKRYNELQTELKKSETELQDSELNLKSIEAKTQNFRNRLYGGGVSNPKELSSIEKEIEMLSKSRSSLDERILELYDTVEQQQADVKKITALLEQLKAKNQKQTAEFNSKSQELNNEIARLESERAKVITNITDKPMLQRYEAMRTKHKDTGLAKVEDGKCGGCHITITAYMKRMLKADDHFQSCESCGRILFVEE